MSRRQWHLQPPSGSRVTRASCKSAGDDVNSNFAPGGARREDARAPDWSHDSAFANLRMPHGTVSTAPTRPQHETGPRLLAGKRGPQQSQRRAPTNLAAVVPQSKDLAHSDASNDK